MTMNWIPNESLVEFSSRALPVLADSAVKGLVLLGAAAIGSALLRRSSASARHLVWTLALGGMLLLPVLSVALPKWQVPVLPPSFPSEGTYKTNATYTTYPNDPTAAARSLSSSGALASAGSAGAAPNALSAERGVFSWGAPPPSSFRAALSSAPDMIASPDGFPRSWAFGVAVAWALGTLAALLPLAVGLALVSRLLSRARPFGQERWLAPIRSMAESLGLRRNVRVLRADADTMPMACGILRPTILLPRAIEDWPEEKRRTVILHELAHVRRRDCLTHALGRLACALHWFNPLAWWALRRMRIERERACDDLVLTAGERPSDYADYLLDVARSMRSGALLSAAAITMARPSHLEGRLLAILDPRRNRGAVKWWAIAVSVIVLLAVAVPLGMLKFSQNKVFADMTPEQRAAFEKWLTVPVALPADALEVRPFSEETARAVEDFYKEWDRLDKATAEAKSEAMAQSLPALSPETVPVEELRYFEPLSEAFARVVGQPDYEAEVWSLNWDPGALVPEDFAARRTAYRAQQARTLSLWCSGDNDGALEGLRVLLRAPVCHAYSPSIVKMLSLSWLRTALDVAERMMTEADSPEFAQAVRTRLADVRESLRSIGFRDDIDALTLDHIGMVRQYKRKGIDAGVTYGAGLDWMIAASRSQVEGLRRFSLPRATTPAQKRQAEEFIAASEKFIELYERTAQARSQQPKWSNALARNAGLITVAALYKIASPNAEHSLRLTRETFERYDRLIGPRAPDSIETGTSDPCTSSASSVARPNLALQSAAQFPPTDTSFEPAVEFEPELEMTMRLGKGADGTGGDFVDFAYGVVMPWPEPGAIIDAKTFHSWSRTQSVDAYYAPDGLVAIQMWAFPTDNAAYDNTTIVRFNAWLRDALVNNPSGKTETVLGRNGLPATYLVRILRNDDIPGESGLLRVERPDPASESIRVRFKKGMTESEREAARAQREAYRIEPELREVLDAVRRYEADHGKWPAALQDLLNAEKPGPYVNPSEKGRLDRFVYCPPKKGLLQPKLESQIVLYPKYERWPGRLRIGSADGSTADWVMGEERLIEATRPRAKVDTSTRETTGTALGAVAVRGVVEREIGFSSAWLDLDTGNEIDMPGEVASGGDKRANEWFEKNPVDLTAQGKGGLEALFTFVGTLVTVVDNSLWDSPDAAQTLRDRLPAQPVGGGLGNSDQQIRAISSEREKLPVTFGFRTREGGLGLLQVLEHVKKDNGWGLKIRYRLLPDETPAPAETPTPQAGADAKEEAIRAIKARMKILRSRKMRFEYTRVSESREQKDKPAYVEQCTLLAYGGNYREEARKPDGSVEYRYYADAAQPGDTRYTGEMSCYDGIRVHLAIDPKAPPTLDLHPYSFMHWIDSGIPRQWSVPSVGYWRGSSEVGAIHLNAEHGGYRCVQLDEGDRADYYAPELGWSYIGGARSDFQDFVQIDGIYWPRSIAHDNSTLTISKIESDADFAPADLDLPRPQTGWIVRPWYEGRRFDPDGITGNSGSSTVSFADVVWSTSLGAEEKRFLMLAASGMRFTKTWQATQTGYPRPYLDPERNVVVWAKYDKDLKKRIRVHEGDALPDSFGPPPWQRTKDLIDGWFVEKSGRVESPMPSNDTRAATDSLSSHRLQFRWVARDDERVNAEKVPVHNATGSERELWVEKEILLSERDILTAEVMPQPFENNYRVRFQFRSDGATQRLADLTGQNLNRRLAILFDGKIFSAPIVRERIPNGMGIIEVGAKKEEAEAIVKAIAAPVSPVPPTMKGVIERTVGWEKGVSPNVSWLDLDTGGAFQTPTDIVGGGETEMLDWAKKCGIDLEVGGYGEAARVDKVMFVGALVGLLDNSVWDLPASDAERVLRDRLRAESGGGKPAPTQWETRVIASGGAELPMTFGFWTREGGLGLLQVLEHVKEDDAWALRIRSRIIAEKAPLPVTVSGPGKNAAALEEAIRNIQARMHLLQSRKMRFEYARMADSDGKRYTERYALLAYRGDYRVEVPEPDGTVGYRYFIHTPRLEEGTAPEETDLLNAIWASVSEKPGTPRKIALSSSVAAMSEQVDGGLPYLWVMMTPTFSADWLRKYGAVPLETQWAGRRCVALPGYPTMHYAPELGWSLLGGEGLRFGDSAQFDGVYLPQRISTSISDEAATVTISSIDANANFDPALLKLPKFEPGCSISFSVSTWHSEENGVGNPGSPAGKEYEIVWSKPLRPEDQRLLTAAKSMLCRSDFQQALAAGYPMPYYDEGRDLIVWAKYDKAAQKQEKVHEGDTLPGKYGVAPWQKGTEIVDKWLAGE